MHIDIWLIMIFAYWYSEHQHCNDDIAYIPMRISISISEYQYEYEYIDIILLLNIEYRISNWICNIYIYMRIIYINIEYNNIQYILIYWILLYWYAQQVLLFSAKQCYHGKKSPNIYININIFYINIINFNIIKI